MKALILVGGYGTRLRPLTLTCPKPLVEFANKPLVFHQIEALSAAGVTEVVLAVSYQPEELVAAVDRWQEEHPGVKVTISVETEPLGTAGPIALARELLNDGDPFFVLNSDVVCEFPFTAMLNFHRAHGAEGTILTTPVEDPSKYGVIVSSASGQIERFVEKPLEFVGNQINAGLYLFSGKFLKRVSLKPTSIEREVFPKVAADNALFAMKLPGFWMDVGQPPDFLHGTKLYLAYLRDQQPDRLVVKSGGGGSFVTKGNVLIHETAKVGANCEIGPDVVIGKDCVVGDGVRLARCTLLEGVHIKSHSLIDKAIVGWHSTVGKWCRLTDLCVFGADVHVPNELSLVGVRVLPHKGLKHSIHEPTIIM